MFARTREPQDFFQKKWHSEGGDAGIFPATSIRQQPARGGKQQKAHDFVSSQRFEVFMALVILFNVFLILVETDSTAECVSESRDLAECQHNWIAAVNSVLLLIYTAETFLRLYAERVQCFLNFWNIMDAVVLVCCWSDLILVLVNRRFPGPSAALLRMFRVARLARILRLISIFPELYELVRGFFAAAMAMFWGFVCIICFIIIFSIIAVEVLHPINVSLSHDNDYCQEGFSSVWNAMLMFVQTLVAGDSWGQCTIPIIQHTKATFVFFVLSVICVQLGITNLILAVVVARAEAGAQEDVQHRLQQKDRARQRAAEQMREDLSTIDENGNGKISVDELTEGFNSNVSLQETLRSLDMRKIDLKDFFDLLDVASHGEIEYHKLVDTIVSSTEGDHRKHMMMLRLETAEIGRILKKNRDEMLDIHKLIKSEIGPIPNMDKFDMKETRKPMFSTALIPETARPLGRRPSVNELKPATVSKGTAMFQHTPPMEHPSITISIDYFQSLRDKVRKLEHDLQQTFDSLAMAITEDLHPYTAQACDFPLSL